MDVVNARVWRIFVPLYFVASTVVAALSPLLFGATGVRSLPAWTACLSGDCLSGGRETYRDSSLPRRI